MYKMTFLLRKIQCWIWGICLFTLGCIGCKKETDGERFPANPIVILYENDVHCALEGYAKLFDIQAQKRTLTPYVTTVSCGDFIQGDRIASVSDGKNIIDLMNRVGYDVVTLGNHEFDYGVERTFQLTSMLKATTVSANFRNLETGQLPFSPYKIIRYGKVEIAYLGLTTTMTPHDLIPQTFRDSTGKVIYDFSRDFFYEKVQQYVDEAREAGADYVVVLSHVGGNNQQEHPSALTLIANTTGIDVVLDGHDHQVIADTLIENRMGEPVLLSTTGAKFKYIGILTLAVNGKFTTQLVDLESDSISSNQEIVQFIQEIKDNTLATGERVVGSSSVDLWGEDASGNRLIRKQETNIGNFCCDAFRLVLNTDIALLNGGGIRANLLAGEVTYNDCYAVFPFNNTACIGTLTGQELLDALEFSVSSLPIADGSFLQVSGLKFEVDSTLPTPVVRDEEEFFSHVGPGKRRVSNLQIWNQTVRAYQPVDLQRRYSIAGIDYQLKNSGSSGILRTVVLQKEHVGQDVDILVNYIQQILSGKIDERYAQTEGRILIK